MKKTEIYEYLISKNIWHEITEHEAVFNMEEASALSLPYPEAEAKSLFLRDDKKQNYYLITVRGEKKVDLKAFRRANHTRALTFASDADLLSILGLTPGAVTPLGILNDAERKAVVFFDREFLQEPARIGVHPNDNTATLWLKTEDLIRIIEEHGTTVQVADY